MKFINVLAFAILISINALSQSDSIALLSCRTWGKADWTRIEQHYGHKFRGDGATIREMDGNILAVSPAYAEVYGDDVFIRWLLTDTTIFYDIKVSNNQGDLIYTTSSNKCGIYIPFGILRQETSASALQIVVHRTNNKGGYLWGIELAVDEARPSYRKQIEKELAEVLTNVSPEQTAMTIVNYFIQNNRYADALYTLELAKQNDPGNFNITKKYWLTVNEMFINKRR